MDNCNLRNKRWWGQRDTGHKILFEPLNGQMIQKIESGFVTFPHLSKLCKKSEKSNGGKYENFCDWQTDRQTTERTDGGGFTGTPVGVLKMGLMYPDVYWIK